MGALSENQLKKHICAGIVAHVDAGKTTLSEALLYLSGSIRKLGRVDNQDAFLDTCQLERARGITIFSKQAELQWNGTSVTLLDTPGHVDFSAEMERTLQVLDYAILVISGADGVQGHTETLWRLLARYEIPVFLFINKMDQPGTDRGALMKELKKRLDEGCIDFQEEGTEEFNEQAAMCEEKLLDAYLETGTVEEEEIRRLIQKRKLFPCFFGSALKLQGVKELLDSFCRLSKLPCYSEDFGARIYKISRDSQGNRLSHLKVTGGILKVKTAPVSGCPDKINQIRIYSGSRFETVQEAPAGTVCAVSGLSSSFAGQGLGFEEELAAPVLEPVLTYRLILPEGCDAASFLPKLRQLEEEEPLLRVLWNESLQEISMQMMGQVQIEVLKSQMEERFSVLAEFGTGSIVYKETIAGPVEGAGHFEPLRHYAEVHLLLEPGEPGSGLSFGSLCSEDVLDKNWQRLVFTHLEERQHPGVLTGSPITDMRILLTAGRAHPKHTEGGDFRQAVCRALRQGLMEAESLLLEPWYSYRLEVPEPSIGRAMNDMEQRSGTCVLEESRDGMAVLTGQAPAVCLTEYQAEVTSYSRGRGRLSCSLLGYRPCHNTEEVITRIGYDPERDTDNPTGSVFCAHGAGFAVPWDQAKAYMHVESGLHLDCEDEKQDGQPRGFKNPGSSTRQEAAEEMWMGTEEIDAILERTFYSNSRGKDTPRKKYSSGVRKQRRFPEEPSSQPIRSALKPAGKKQEYLLVDGYNVIFAWERLKALAEDNLDGARMALLDMLCNYQAVRQCSLMVVFDAYRVEGHTTEVSAYHNIQVVFTREAETADQYIEKFAHENAGRFDVSVATSDGVEQVIILGQGCRLISSRELEQELERMNQALREEFLLETEKKGIRLSDLLTEEELLRLRQEIEPETE